MMYKYIKIDNPTADLMWSKPIYRWFYRTSACIDYGTSRGKISDYVASVTMNETERAFESLDESNGLTLLWWRIKAVTTSEDCSYIFTSSNKEEGLLQDLIYCR